MKNKVINFYVDESGKPDPKLNNLHDKFYILTGVISDHVANSLIGLTLHKTFREFDMDFEEFHSKDFFRGKKGWREYSIDERMEFISTFLKRVAKEIKEEEGFITTISVVGMKTKESNQNNTVLESYNIQNVFEKLLERVFLKTRRIHENQDEHIIIKIYADVSELNPKLRDALNYSLVRGKYLANYKEIIEGKIRFNNEIKFIDSRLSYSIQFADLAGYIIHKYYKSKEGVPDKHFDFEHLIEYLFPFLDKQGTIISGYGIKKTDIYKKSLRKETS